MQSLESWSTAPEYRPFFRDKAWGGFGILGPETGLDTPGAEVRAAKGINAASSSVTGYWSGAVSRVCWAPHSRATGPRSLKTSRWWSMIRITSISRRMVGDCRCGISRNGMGIFQN